MPEKDEMIKQQILDAAKEVLKKWGFHKSTMEDIAKVAGKGKSTLYYYYKSKEEIFDAAARQEIEQSFRLALEAVQQVSKSSKKLRTYINTIFQEMSKRAGFYTVFAQEVREDSKLIARIVTDYNNIELKIIKDILSLGKANNEFSFSEDAEVERAAFIITLMLRNLQMEFIVNHTIDDLGAHTNMISHLLLNGLKH